MGNNYQSLEHKDDEFDTDVLSVSLKFQKESQCEEDPAFEQNLECMIYRC